MRKIALILTLAGLLLPAFGVTASDAAYPGRNGRIAFASDRSGNFAIWTMAPDGSDAKQLTDPEPPYYDCSPAWSPDGALVAFTRGVSGAGTSQIWVVKGDGSVEQQLTNAPHHNAGPTWSPDGRRIAFSSNREFIITNPDIWVMNADGTEQTKLIGFQYADEFPAWSPGGDRILFGGGPPSPIPFAFWTVKPDGTGLAPFGFGDYTASTDWSPDASSVVADGAGVFVLAAADGYPRRLLEGGNFYPAWSPDGTKIAYVHGYSQKDIWTMNPDGSEQDPVAILPGEDDQPDWQPVESRSPDCSRVSASPASMWPPNQKLVTVSLAGATDRDGDLVTVTATGVTSDESAIGDFVLGPAGNQVRLRAERNGAGDGRIYTIAFEASDARGGRCTGTATVTVPHSRGRAKSPHH